MKVMYISRRDGWITILATNYGYQLGRESYLYYTMRGAIKAYREKYGLKYKKLEIKYV